MPLEAPVINATRRAMLLSCQRSHPEVCYFGLWQRIDQEQQSMASRFSAFLAASVLALVSAGAVAAKPKAPDEESLRNPVQFPGTPWSFDGFLVTMPTDEGWFSIAKDAHYADLAKNYPGGVQAAVVVEARRLEAAVAKAEELLKLVRDEQTALPDPNMKLLDYTAEPFSPKGVLCTRFTVKFEDGRTQGSTPATLLVRGVSCVPPNTQQVVVSVRCAQRSTASEWSAAVQAATEPTLQSLRFVVADNAAVRQARDAVRSENPGSAVALLKPSAEEGDAEAALFLGNIYLYGRGVEPDYQAARRYLETASREGRVDALYNLGAMYDKGIGGQRDVRQALHFFSLAADQRDSQAQLNLALIYINGNGVERDVPRGKEWLRRAAANGNKRAEGLLSVGGPAQQ
jgi:TPR repeat protein